MTDGLSDWTKRLVAMLRKNAAVFILLALGLVLLMLPGKGEEADTPAQTPTGQSGGTGDSGGTETGDERSLYETEQMLAQLLSAIDGAGEVRVMLSLDTRDETVYAADVDSGGSTTVIVSAGSQTQQAVVSSVNCARYRGAVVLAQGADSPTVRLMITQAISALTGLGADSISVLKMKS